jgi:drug/metabolite transporter (DMT)-like permease
MLTFLAVFVRIITSPLSNVFQKRICNDGQSPLFITFFTYLGISVVIIPAAYSIDWFTFPFAFWIYSLLIGLLAALGNGFLVKAIQSGELSVLGPINAYKSVVGMIFGIILLREIPGIFGVFGIVFIVAGSYFVIDTGTHSERFSRSILMRPDLRYRIAAMVLAAVEAVFIKKVILYSDPNTAFVVWCWGGAVFSLLFMPFQREREKFVWSSEWKKAGADILQYIGLVSSVGLMQLATNYAFANIPVGYALALFQLSAVLSIFYGWFFFKESQIVR